MERQSAIKKLIDSVSGLQTDLEAGERGCSDACCCMLLGTIMRERKKHRIGDVWSVTPFDGRSLEASKQVIMEFQSPRWFSHASSYSSIHGCSLVKLLKPDINEIWTSLEGFELDDFVCKNIPVFKT